MRQRWAWAAVVVFCASSSLLLARQGTVLTKDNKPFDGDVTVDQTAGTVTVLINNVPYTLKLANVQSIIYVDEVDADVRQKMAVMGAKDVKGRLALARYAMDHHALVAARDVLADAQKIEPENPDVRAMLENVKTQLRSQPTTGRSRGSDTQPAIAPVAPPTVVPAAGTPPVTPGAAKPGMVTREVTADEINFIRESEIRDGETVRVKLDGDVRRRFAEYINMPFADFSRLPVMQQAFMILDKGRPDMKADVKLLSDPPAIASFRKNVQRTLIAGCATSKCHGGTEPAAFRLYPQDNEAAAYTNFLVLAQYSTSIGGRQVSLLDRQTAEQSLLLSYMLPPSITDNPHPDAKGYRGAVRNKADPRHAAAIVWIRDGLKPLATDYSKLNLSAPPATQPSASASGAHP
jgi:hypothetical protein